MLLNVNFFLLLLELSGLLLQLARHRTDTLTEKKPDEEKIVFQI